MIVITIISILASIAQPSFQQYRIRAKETSLRRTLYVFRDVIDQHYADRGQYPDSLEELVAKTYIRAIPQDPFTRSADTWITTPPGEGEKGSVFDVHSGSDLVGLDGIPYNEY